MVRRSIAALLLWSMAAWAEIALAPLFSIHVAHLASTKAASHEHAMPASHPCCPGGAQAVAANFAVKAAGLPCEEQHRCCFRQGPASPPTTAKECVNAAPEISIASAGIGADFATRPSPHSPTQPAAPIPPGTLGVVLRI